MKDNKTVKHCKKWSGIKPWHKQRIYCDFFLCVCGFSFCMRHNFAYLQVKLYVWKSTSSLLAQRHSHRIKASDHTWAFRSRPPADFSCTDGMKGMNSIKQLEDPGWYRADYTLIRTGIYHYVGCNILQTGWVGLINLLAKEAEKQVWAAELWHFKLHLGKSTWGDSSEQSPALGESCASSAYCHQTRHNYFWHLPLYFQHFLFAA